MFVITVETKFGVQYYAIDHSSGGYPYWANNISSAVFFSTYDAAKDAITNKNDFVESWFEGPPIMIHNGLKLSNINTKNTGVFSINKVSLNMVEAEQITAEVGVKLNAESSS